MSRLFNTTFPLLCCTGIFGAWFLVGFQMDAMEDLRMVISLALGASMPLIYIVIQDKIRNVFTWYARPQRSWMDVIIPPKENRKLDEIKQRFDYDRPFVSMAIKIEIPNA